MEKISGNGVCLVVGAGDATGGAVARRFARISSTVQKRRGCEKIFLSQFQGIGLQGIASARCGNGAAES